MDQNLKPQRILYFCCNEVQRCREAGDKPLLLMAAKSIQRVVVGSVLVAFSLLGWVLKGHYQALCLQQLRKRVFSTQTDLPVLTVTGHGPDRA